MRDWLIKKREVAGYTQEQVAKMAKIKRSYYTMIERGNRRPSVDVAKNIADTLSFEWTIFFQHDSNEMTHDK